MYKKFLSISTDDPKIHLLRAMISSTLSFMLDFLTLIVLVEIFHLHYVPGGIAGFIAGTSLNYLLSVKWIFNVRKYHSIILEYSIFILLGASGGFLNIGLLWLFTEKAGIYYMISRILAATLVFFFNFTGRKLILFTKPAK